MFNCLSILAYMAFAAFAALLVNVGIGRHVLLCR